MDEEIKIQKKNVQNLKEHKANILDVKINQ